MKSLGWYSFIALLMADVVAVVMLKLTTTVHLHNVGIVGLVVFILVFVVLWFSGHARRSAQKREEQAQARIAELEKQADPQPQPTPANGTAK